MCVFQLWFSQGTCSAVRLLGHMVVLSLVFQEISVLFSIVAVSIYILTNTVSGFNFSTSSPAFVVCRTFFFFFNDDGHSDLCEGLLHCSFDLHFSNNKPCLTQ